MNNINVTVELCAEDRARLDMILEALQNAGAPAAAPEKPQEASKPVADETPAPVAEEPVVAAEPAKEEPVVEEPAKVVSLSDVQQKVVALSAAGQKEKVREIVKRYAERVSLIPEDKAAEVWDLLTALAGE